MHTYKVVCPRCGKRFFDVFHGATGSVSVKCPRCKIFSIIDLIAASLQKSDNSNEAVAKTANPA